MMRTAERHGELIADFARQRLPLDETKVMWIAGLTPADQAGLRCHKLQMSFVAVAARFGEGERAFIDHWLRF